MSSTITTNTLYEVVKEFDTKAFITFLIEKKLGLNENEIQSFYDQRIDGDSFLMLNEERLKECKIRIELRVKLINLINNLNSQSKFYKIVYLYVLIFIYADVFLVSYFIVFITYSYDSTIYYNI